MEDCKGKKFEALVNPDKKGVSNFISLDEMPDDLKVTNGSNYTREGSYLDKKYFFEKVYEKGTINTHKDKQSSGIGKGKLISLKLDGLIRR